MLFLGGGLLAWNLFARGQAAYSLNFLPGKIKTLTWDGVRPVIVVEMIVQNTSNHSFNILSIAGNVYTNQNGKTILIGTVSDFVTKQIAPISENRLDISFRLQLQGVVADILNIFQTGLNPQTITLKAFANVDGLQIPLDYNYQLG